MDDSFSHFRQDQSARHSPVFTSLIPASSAYGPWCPIISTELQRILFSDGLERDILALSIGQRVRCISGETAVDDKHPAAPGPDDEKIQEMLWETTFHSELIRKKKESGFDHFLGLELSAMPRSARQKLKLLYVRDYLLKNTDEQHPATLKEITAFLDSNGIQAERKSLYDDIEALRSYGMDIIRDSGNYYVGNRTFELPELKLLVDSVQSSKFITYKKTGTLIRKIEEMASIYEARLLNRQVFVTNRIKSMNESIYYNVDEIHGGIVQNKEIRFHYFEWNTAKEKVFRRNGDWYEVSPYALTWDDENYYLVAYDSEAGIIKHYRVDKMADITITDKGRDGKEVFATLDMAVYSQKVFGMFSGPEKNVQLRAANHLVGAILDRFGKDVSIIPDGMDHFTVRVNAIVSPQFFSWVNAFGTDMMIIAPDDVAAEIREHVDRLHAAYHGQSY